MVGHDVMALPSETEQLREQLLRAQRLSSVGTLASSVAHEFNNILTTLINYAKLGLRPDSTEPGRLQALEKILKGSQRAATIISSMLGFARNQSTHRDVTDLQVAKFVQRIGTSPKLRDFRQFAHVCRRPFCNVGRRVLFCFVSGGTRYLSKSMPSLLGSRGERYN